MIEEGLPAFINIHVVRHLWHGGTGTDGPPEWDRFSIVKEEMGRLGLDKEAEDAEITAENRADDLWRPALEGVR